MTIGGVYTPVILTSFLITTHYYIFNIQSLVSIDAVSGLSEQWATVAATPLMLKLPMTLPRDEHMNSASRDHPLYTASGTLSIIVQMR